MTFRHCIWTFFALLLAMTWAVPTGQGVLRSVHFHDNFDSADLTGWQLPFPEDWEILGGPNSHYLHMKHNREPGVPRRPLQFALIKDVPVGSFQFQTLVRRAGKSMIIVFNYVDTLHFYYAHLSGDRGEDQPVHNGIFIVNGEPRRRIAGLDATPALPDSEWHHVRIVRKVHKGSIELYMDHANKPLFSIGDTTFNCGLVGIGSFDETGDFTDVDLRSDDGACKRGAMVRSAFLK